MDISQLSNLIILDSSLGPLKGRFNVCKDKMRFLALLSPTCPLCRDQGARVDWTDLPPKPNYWMHQLTDDWAKNDHYRTGHDF